jgi:hypothetical protein
MRQMKHIYSLAALALIFSGLLSCSKIDTGGGGGGNSTTKGAITGSIIMYDDKGNANADDKAGVKVSLLKGGVEVSKATTLTTGKFAFANVPYDTYDMSYSRSDIGTYKVFNVTHAYNASATVNGTLLSTIQLGQLSSTSITAFTFQDSTYNGVPGMSYTISVSPDPSTTSRGFFRIFMSLDPQVSNANYGVVATPRSLISNNATGGFTRDELRTIYGFSSGQTVYMIAYGESAQPNDYTDPVSGKRIFPNLNMTTQPAFSFIVP